MKNLINEKLLSLKQIEMEIQNIYHKSLKLNKDIYDFDFLMVTVADRTLKHSRGFRTLLEDKNFSCAVILIRCQIDTIMRCYASRAYEGGVKDFIYKFLSSERIDLLKSKDGEKMRDSNLIKIVEKEYPGIEELYKKTCEYIHMTGNHFFMSFGSSIKKSDEKKIEGYISIYDTSASNNDYIEIVEIFATITKYIFNEIKKYIEEYRKTPL